MAYNPDQIENYKDFYQWLFPTSIPSSDDRQGIKFPITTPKERAYFQKCKSCKERLVGSLDKFLRHYGISVGQNDTLIKDPNRFQERSKIWLNDRSQHFMRISCILKSLNELGCRKEASEFYRFLQTLYNEYPVIQDRTKEE